MTTLELDGRLILKWNHPPGYKADNVLRSNGFVWNQEHRGWEQEAKPGIKDAIFTLAIRADCMPLFPEQSLKLASKVIFDKGFNKKGIAPKITKEG